MKVLLVFGTRPEAIKMAPLVKALQKAPSVELKVCSTGQHKEMLDQVMEFFGIEAHYELNIMQPGQDLTDSTCRILQGMRDVLADFHPDWVLVHGDTTTAAATTLAAFYAGVKVGHVEAGLRTGNLQAPFPEEGNRLLIDRFASACFAPTQQNVNNLLNEGIKPESIVLTGNTVIDALLLTTQKVSDFSEKVPEKVRKAFEQDRRVVLVTGHRRENFGRGFEQICHALQEVARRYADVTIVYPVHLNPNVQQPVLKYLSDTAHILLTDPLDYPDFVHAMQKSWVILTDSGGVQEEAPSLGKPVLVMRDTTERPEALAAGTVQLVGTDSARIVEAIAKYWQEGTTANVMNPYGDGRASERIVAYLTQQKEEVPRPA